MVFLRPYSEPPDLRWWRRTDVPTLVIVPQEVDREPTVLEVSREEFERLGGQFCASAGLLPDEIDALDRVILRKTPVISEELLDQLLEVEPSREGSLEYRPCRVRLRNGTILDRVYVVDTEKFIDSHSWLVWPATDPKKKSISLSDVEAIEESPARLPARLAIKMYEAGESAMGGCFFILVLSDGRRFPCATGNAVDFVELPPDVTPDMIVDLGPHEGRMEKDRLRSADFFWCGFRMPARDSSGG